MADNKLARLSGDLSLENRTEISNLPFIKRNNDQIVFWSVTPSGDYVKDCTTGREFGALALDHMVEADFAPLLTWCISDMPPHKDWSGIEIGFLEFFSEIAVSNFTSRCIKFGNLSN